MTEKPVALPSQQDWSKSPNGYLRHAARLAGSAPQVCIHCGEKDRHRGDCPNYKAPATPIKSEAGWLIENYDHFPRHLWVRVVRTSPTKAEITWTDDSAIALRFARECDAANFAMLFPQEFTLAKITEHIWS